LADSKPELNLLPPAGTFERIRLVELMTFIGTEIHQKFVPIFRDYVSDDAKDKFREILVVNFSSLDEQFVDGHTYLTGETFTVADAYLFAVTPWTERTHVSIGHLKRLWAFQERVATRPAVQKSLRDEANAAAELP
jgi:glutathione S-transferase